MSKDKGCAGTYYVCGYTRSDGTEVCGYYRTCGAMHNSDTESTNSKTNNAKNDDIGLGRNSDNIINGDFLSPYRLYARVEENHAVNETDTYKQDLIDEVKNTEVEVKGIGKIKAEDLIPNLEKYIEDTRTKMEKRADRIYGSMKNNEYYHDIKLIATAFPYFVERVIQEMAIRLKKDVNSISKIITRKDILNSYEWENFTKDIMENHNTKKFFNDIKNPSKFLKNMEKDKKHQEDLKEMINDYINGGEISQFAADIFGIPDAGGLLRINGSNSNLNTNYTKDAEKYNNPEELPEKFKDTIKTKLKSQGLNENSKGLYFNSNSELSKRISLSPEIISLAKKEKDKINTFCNYDSEKAIPLRNKTSIEYKKNNMYYAFHYADVYNLKYDMFGNITGDLIDTTDFNAGKNEPILIQKARELQDEGIIEPKFVIIHFVIPKKIVNKEILSE